MKRPTPLPGLETPGRIAAACALGTGIEAAVAWRFGWSPALPAYCYFGVAAAVISMTDLGTRRVPNRVVLPAYLAGPALLALASALSGSWWPLGRGGIAMALLAGFYLLLGLAFPAGMGFGDVKWAGVIGLYLGWLAWTTVSTGTLIAFLAAAVFVTARHLLAGRGWRIVPMAPFMSAGALVGVLITR